MIGTTREEIKELNQIDLIDYLRKTDSNNIRIRKNGTITHKSKDNLVICVAIDLSSLILLV